MRKRCAGPILEPREVVEVAAVRDDVDGSARAEASHLVRDRLRHAGDSVGLSRDEAGDLLHCGLPGAGGRRVVAAVLVRDEWVAEVGDPARAGRLLDGGADEVHGGRRRRRDHDVDALAPHDANRGGDRREVPGDARIREEQPPRGDLRLDESAIEPVGGGELLRGLPRPWAEVASAMNPRLCGHAQLGIGVHPLRVVRREHVRLDAERGQVLRELERALHAPAARGREVHRHEQHLHGCEG